MVQKFEIKIKDDNAVPGHIFGLLQSSGYNVIEVSEVPSELSLEEELMQKIEEVHDGSYIIRIAFSPRKAFIPKKP